MKFITILLIVCVFVSGVGTGSFRAAGAIGKSAGCVGVQFEAG